jgi:hypothetical protein
MHLSPAQQRMLADIAEKGESRPPWGYRDAGRDASSWHRTARSLRALGLVKILRSAHSFRAVRPPTEQEKTEGFQALYTIYQAKLSRLEELKRQGLYGHQLGSPSGALSLARENLERFCENHEITLKI